MPFDIDKLFAHARSKIAHFAINHSGETFYAFAIDANLLCLNSLERFEETLKEYQSRWERKTRMIRAIEDMSEVDLRDEEFFLKFAAEHHGLDRKDSQAVLAVINEHRTRRRSEGCEYYEEEGIRRLRENTGDWAYQGFADMDEEKGFDRDLYTDHYNEAMDAEDGHAPCTQYALAMTQLVDRLRSSDAFNPLTLSEDFTVSWVDHDY